MGERMQAIGSRRWRCLVGAPAALLVAGGAPMRGETGDLTALRTVAARLTVHAIRHRAAVEAALGITLKLESEGPFRFWSGPGFRLAGIPVRDVDYREPTAEADPAAGPLLVLDLEPAACLTIDAIRTAFPDTRITAMPRGSYGERTSVSIESGGGELTFGIAADPPECLNVLVFTRKRTS